ncbi:MAG: hypothetical protein K6C12_00825 [Oscillospiraceae bacterium]|nr:hypothetical protein [Oscillospiraceae bacterium]
MALILKRIDAGGLQVEALYHRRSRYDTPAQRAAKEKASSEAQRRMNQIYSYQKLELLLATNFPAPGSALVVTLTYDDDHMPKDRKQALRHLRLFRAKLKKEREAARLPEPVAFWCVEVLTAEDGRWHFHMVINNTGFDAEMIRRCWIYGSNIQIEKLRVDKEKNWESLARYLSKEPRECQDELAKPGQHAWSCTRNVLRPEVDTVTVPDDYKLSAPEGSEVLLDEQKRTEFASYHILKYRYPGVRAMVKAARRRQRRRERTARRR